VKSYEHLLELAEPDRHIVQFYGANERLLIRNLSLYLGAGLHRGDTVLAVLTPERREELMRQLRALRVDTSRAVDAGQMVVMNADEILPRVMANGEPAWEPFVRTVGHVIRGLRPDRGYRRLRVYGEMVDVLWRLGCMPQAVRLEALWNRLHQILPFQLLCAYGIDPSRTQASEGAIEQVLCAHTHHITAVQ
jgi:hypothetical protein